MQKNKYFITAKKWKMTERNSWILENNRYWKHKIKPEILLYMLNKDNAE